VGRQNENEEQESNHKECPLSSLFLESPSFHRGPLSDAGEDGRGCGVKLARHEDGYQIVALRGSATCPSAVSRALLRLARDFDGALLARVLGWIERDSIADGQEGKEVLRRY